MKAENKTNLRVLFFLLGDQRKASSRVRGFWIADELEQLGLRCTLRWKHDKLNLLLFAWEVLRNDAVVFQKTYSRYHRWLMLFANILGKRTFLDLDDAPSKTRSPGTLRNVEAMMRMADGVFVGSNNLLDYSQRHQPKSYLLPSSINLKYYTVEEERKYNARVCLGWIGNGTHYKRDLIDILAAPLKELASHYRIRFKIVGACGVRELYETFKAIPSLEIDFVDSIDWSNPGAVSEAIQDFDIGLYPLIVNEFNIYKCGFKALEYMAIGIPVVSSPVAINVDIITPGQDGLFADSNEGWTSALSELICDVEKRREMGKAGRKKVEERFSTAQVAKNLLTIIAKQ
jgi:glycosyltransferase involved in cell wall biosynthesis